MLEPETPASSPAPQPSTVEDSNVSSSAPTWIERAFFGPKGLHAVWRVLLYLACGVFIVLSLGWLGGPYFASPATTAAQLWGQMYSEVSLLLGAILPAFLMARIEKRSFDDYGLPRRDAFGGLFWIGAASGLIAITLLMIAMRGAHVFDFGHLALHGNWILRFAAFWAVYFLVVGLTEEFLLRGYLMRVSTDLMGFWPAAGLLSIAFGAIHLFNRDENVIGALGAAVIGFFFCLTLRRTGSLWFAVGFHAFWDWGETFLYAVPDSGTTEPGHLLSSSFSGPTWLTGGKVGPEASVFCFVLVGLLWVAFDRVYPVARYGTHPKAAQNRGDAEPSSAAIL